MIPVSRPSIPSARNVVVTLVLLAAISPFVVFAVPEVVGADEGYVVLSGSMEPALSPGDVVIVDASGPVGVGDIITYRTGDTVPTTHRVVGERDGGYETKGDANDNVDAGLVAPDAVVGRVVITIPLLGHVILWANTPVGYVSFVIVPLVLLGVSELIAWARREPETPADEPTEPTPAADAVEPPEDIDIEAVASADPADGAVEEAPAFDWQAEDDGVDSTGPTGAEGTDGGPAPGVNRPAPDPDDPSPADTVQVAVVDLKLTLLAMGILFVYAGWNVYREFAATAAPTPLSVGAFTAGLLGLAFAGSVTVAAWRAARAAGSDPTPALADGGSPEEGRDE